MSKFSADKALIFILLSPAKHSYSVFVAVRLRMSFPRACLTRVRNPETSVWTGKKIGILRAAATRENDKLGIVQDQSRHYNMQVSIAS